MASIPSRALARAAFARFQTSGPLSRPTDAACPSLARELDFQASGVGCSHWTRFGRRAYVRGSCNDPVTSEDTPSDPSDGAAPTNQAGFMEDADAKEDIDWDAFHVDSVIDDPVKASVSVQAPRRPKLPTSMKKLNKALGRKRVIDLPDHDLIETFVRGRGPGGQAINKTNSSVSLVHIPTGIRIQSQPTRSREQNRIAARHILSEKLDELRAKGIWPVATADDGQKTVPAVDSSESVLTDKQQRRASKKQEEKDLAEAYTKSELRAAKERARKLNRAKKHKKKKRKMDEGAVAFEGDEPGPA